MLIVGIVESCVTALVCGLIALRATREKKTWAMRWIRAGVLVLGIGALGDVASLLVWSTHIPFISTAIEAILWSHFSTIGVISFLRHRRRPSRSERLVTALAALSSSFGFVWLTALGSVVREGEVSTADRVTGTVMLCAIAIQLSVIVVTLKHTEHGVLPGFAAFAGGSLTVSFTHALASFDQLGLLSTPRQVTELFMLIGVTGLGVSLWITNSKRAPRPSRLGLVPLFYGPALIAIVVSIGRFADTPDEYVFGLTSLVLFATLIAQTLSHRSAARRTQVALERRVIQRTHELEQASQLVNRAVEFAADGIIALDPSQLILFMNPASQRILGDTDDILDMIRTRLQQGDTCFELLDETVSPPRTIRVFGTCLDFSSVSWVLTLRDVTEEIGLLHMKTRMLTAVSHENRAVR